MIEKSNTIPTTGDIVVSNASDGFIESIIAVHKTNDTDYLETKLHRCDGKTLLDGARYSVCDCGSFEGNKSISTMLTYRQTLYKHLHE